MNPANTTSETVPGKETLNTSENRLFLFQETEEPGICDHREGQEGPALRSGAMYLTNKGHIIYHTIDEQRDTQHYFWGEYRTTDAGITYRLTDAYFYPGKWDARWVGPDPDYAKGSTRKVDGPELVLQRSTCDALAFFRRYDAAERSEAARGRAPLQPQGIDFWPFHETKDMKFYSWLFQQIPVLRDL